jgi:hypothetical protein
MRRSGVVTVWVGILVLPALVIVFGLFYGW